MLCLSKDIVYLCTVDDEASNDTETQAINSNNWCNLMKCIWHNIDQSGPYKHTESSNSNSLSKR